MNGLFKISVFLFTSPFKIYSSNLREYPNGKYIKMKIAQRRKKKKLIMSKFALTNYNWDWGQILIHKGPKV